MAVDRPYEAFSFYSVNKVCKLCGQQFQTRSRRRLYCTDECGHQASKEQQKNRYHNKRSLVGVHSRFDKVCAYCKKAFTARKSTARYCSNICCNKDRFHVVERSINCSYCNKLFTTTYKRQKYCSKICFNRNRFRIELLTLTCEVCGKAFETGKKNKKHCSYDCYSVLLKKRDNERTKRVADAYRVAKERKKESMERKKKSEERIAEVRWAF